MLRSLHHEGASCRVPLAFDADDALWHDTAVAVATANQTAAAAAALEAFVRCTIPADRLLWLNLADGASHAVGATQRIRARPATADARHARFPRSRTVNEQKPLHLQPGFVQDALACVMWRRLRGRVPRPLSAPVRKGSRCGVA